MYMLFRAAFVLIEQIWGLQQRLYGSQTLFTTWLFKKKFANPILDL